MGALATDVQPGGWGRYGRRPLRVLALVALIDAIDRGILPSVLTAVPCADGHLWLRHHLRIRLKR